ncbi:fasciclin domain-containing protein [Paracoccus spongiarum]|uniref:Fasciclin domain-containing protein n=1 Tax=Paracoccus spongiarum TaxID=3064387 RepID=A0ABT9JA35_9RHOB|nr:fasciclin domain-containing protein [Paracoccus sp. 2205BS29-5]MDP5306671.1 fasciclin domain-containing protein [Paracoccus sp. 2205BS29-5]
MPRRTDTTIAGLAIANPDLAVLLRLSQAVDDAIPSAGLVAALAGADPLTVFAPVNSAFAALARDLGHTGSSDNDAVADFLLAAVGPATLNQVILYHVLPGAQSSGDISGQATLATLQGATIATELPVLRDNEPDLLDPSLIATDIRASNGVVHLIDRVLLPIDLPGNDAPSIAGIVAASGTGFDRNGADFDILLTAAQTAGLVGALDDAGADLTVFAPDDDAFMALAATLGFEGKGEAEAWGYLVDALTLLSKGASPVPLLTDILSYHIAPQSLQSSQVLASDSIATLLGPDLGVDGTRLVDADPSVADPSITAVDLLASNGIVHVIDGVLLPADLPDSGKGVDFVIGGEGRDKAWLGRGDDWFLGKAGNDRVVAGSGADVVLGGAGGDLLFGRDGTDHLDGGADADLLSGGGGNDSVAGGAGDDRIYGGTGDDSISGGSGNDTIWGGSGADVFAFGPSEGRDIVAGFSRGQDRIDLTGYGFDSFDDLQDNISTSWFGRSVIQLEDARITVYHGWFSQLGEDNFIL